nr:MAG TPA: hypothetical protein [Caudoviricetes sp.]
MNTLAPRGPHKPGDRRMPLALHGVPLPCGVCGPLFRLDIPAFLLWVVCLYP